MDTGDADADTQFQASEDSGEKLTKWKNEPTVLDLKRDLEVSRSAHALQVAKVEGWNVLLHAHDHGRGQSQKHGGTPYGRGEIERERERSKGRSRVQPKLVRRQAEWRYAALSEPFLSANKLFNVTPATFNDADSAKQNEMVLNWQFRTKLNRVKFIDNYVRSTVDEGTCIVRVGWKRQTVNVKTKAPVWTHYAMDNEQDAQKLQQAIQFKAQNPKAFDEQADPAIQAAVSYYEETKMPTVAQQTGTQDVDTVKVLQNFPTVEVLDPRNVFIDPSCNGDLAKALFCIISFETSKSELLKEKKKYKNLDKVNWSANNPVNEPNHETQTPTDFLMTDTMRRKVVAYEYWGWYDMNKDGTLVPFVATWIGSTLIRMEANPYPDEALPIVLVPYMPIKRHLYGEPDAELLEDNQKILGAVTRGMIDLLGRSANGQQGIAKGMLDPLNRRRYESGQDYEFNPNMSPAQGIIEHKFPELPQSALAMTQMVNQEAEALTGVKSFSGGISGSAYGPVAANAKGAMDAAALREMSILRRLATGMVEIGAKIMGMNAVFLSEKETVAVTNDTFVEINREDLKGNFTLETDINTAEVDDAKGQDLAFMLQTCGPSAGPEITMMIMAEIAELKRMPVLAQKLRNFQPSPPPPPSPEQQQLMQLQLQAAQMTVQKLQAEIQLIQSKAVLESARKDMTNLDYVEKETGTTHARNMELQAAKHQGNMELADKQNQGQKDVQAQQSEGQRHLEVTKALTSPTKEGESRPNLHAAIGYNQLAKSTNL